jgi:putative tryptophan/tyrosine transport system substrate-binding protein
MLNMQRRTLDAGRNPIRRREFFALLGSVAAAWPLVARAQPAGKKPTIGILAAATPSIGGQWVAALVQRLAELGWIDGRTASIEQRWSEGRAERFSEIAAEFVRLKVDVIVTSGAADAVVKRQTSAIPIVFAVAGDPVGSGLVASLAHPGSNATGFSLQATDLAGKRLELLSEVRPGLRRLAIIGNVGYSAVVLEMTAAQAAAHTLGLEMTTLQIRRAEDIAPAMESLGGHVEALYVCADPLLVAVGRQISALALAARLPTVYPLREYVDAGGLMSYGPDFLDLWRRAAEIADKILRGAKPADIPVEQPTKFDLVINRKTAKTLGLTIPQTLLATANDLIE